MHEAWIAALERCMALNSGDELGAELREHWNKASEQENNNKK
jgi:hypothetical protein